MSMLRDRIIEKVLKEVSVDSRLEDGIFDIENIQHIGYMCEYLIGKGINADVVYEFVQPLLEKGKHPERQAYNRNGILVTFPTPDYKKEAIRAGTHFEKDPTRGNPNIFAGDKDPATEPPPAASAAQSAPTKTNLPVSISSTTPPAGETGDEDSSEPAQPMPNAFTTAAPQQSPQETPVEPTKLPPPQPTPPKEKEANKDVIKQILKGDDYMLERMVEWFMYNAPEYLKEQLDNHLKRL